MVAGHGKTELFDKLWALAKEVLNTQDLYNKTLLTKIIQNEKAGMWQQKRAN